MVSTSPRPARPKPALAPAAPAVHPANGPVIGWQPGSAMVQMPISRPRMAGPASTWTRVFALAMNQMDRHPVTARPTSASHRLLGDRHGARSARRTSRGHACRSRDGLVDQPGQPPEVPSPRFPDRRFEADGVFPAADQVRVPVLSPLARAEQAVQQASDVIAWVDDAAGHIRRRTVSVARSTRATTLGAGQSPGPGRLREHLRS